MREHYVWHSPHFLPLSKLDSSRRETFPKYKGQYHRKDAERTLVGRLKDEEEWRDQTYKCQPLRDPGL
mgnify:CR=1 FL=1